MSKYNDEFDFCGCQEVEYSPTFLDNKNVFSFQRIKKNNRKKNNSKKYSTTQKIKKLKKKIKILEKRNVYLNNQYKINKSLFEILSSDKRFK